VINTPASSSQSVAELVMGHLFAISRSLNDSYKNMEHGDFSDLKKKYAKGVELRGKTIGIIGFGRIGQSLASYALGCGMNVVAIDRNIHPISIPLILGNDLNLSTSITPVNNLSSVISSLDYISIHVPKQADGSAVIAKNEFESMKKGVRIVNAARGGVINEDDLLVAITNGTVASCALDVFENEPNPRKELLSNEKIACTPHVGAATLEAQDRIGEELATLIIEAFGKK
jgi:D-3-phosphoglycerate dehydrogenase